MRRHHHIRENFSMQQRTCSVVAPVNPWPRRKILLGGIACLLAACRPSAPPVFNSLDITGIGYARNFELKDPDGHTRALRDFSGKLVMMFFGFTQCPDVCPTALTRAAEIKRLLGPDGQRLQVIFVTVDPERDTPAILKAYTAAFDPGFIGLWGDPQQTARVAEEFKIYYKKVPTGDSYTMDHTALSYVFDPLGHVRLAVKHAQSARDCADDLRKLLYPA
jgi:protein SCO1/2